MDRTDFVLALSRMAKDSFVVNFGIRRTLGIVLLAKKRALILKARPVIEDMMSVGLYPSKNVVDQVLSRGGE